MFIVDVTMGGINMGFIKGLFEGKEEPQAENGNEYYDLNK